MSLRLRDTDVRPDRKPDAPDTPASPHAARQRRARWRDPKLWLGAVLVLASVVIGARVLATADDTVAVWQVAHDIPSGGDVAASDLRVTRVHFDDTVVADQYLRAGQPLGPGAHATRDLQAGEILAGSAISSSAAPATRELPLGVGPSHEPADLRPGDRVQVWAVPSAPSGVGARGQPAPTLVLREVTVLSVGSGSVGVSGERQVLVGLGPEVDVGSVLRATTGASVVLVRLAG